jgi:hypothetical protein
MKIVSLKHHHEEISYQSYYEKLVYYPSHFIITNITLWTINQHFSHLLASPCYRFFSGVHHLIMIIHFFQSTFINPPTYIRFFRSVSHACVSMNFISMHNSYKEMLGVEEQPMIYPSNFKIFCFMDVIKSLFSLETSNKLISLTYSDSWFILW